MDHKATLTEIAKAKIEALKKQIAHTRSLKIDRAKRIAEGLTDMDDCFVSERSNDLAISLAETKIKILENGGLSEFPVLRDLETNEIVSDTRFWGKWGPCFRIKDEFVEKFGKYVGDPKRDSTLTKKGLKKEFAMLPAWATFEASGTGMAAAMSAGVKIFRSSWNHAETK